MRSVSERVSPGADVACPCSTQQQSQADGHRGPLSFISVHAGVDKTKRFAIVMPFFHKQERRPRQTSAGRWRFMNGYNTRRAAPCFITLMVLIVQTWRLVENLKHWEREALEPCHAPRADVPTHEVVNADAQRATRNLQPSTRMQACNVQHGA